jgi:hypothetical protein
VRFHDDLADGGVKEVLLPLKELYPVVSLVGEE